MKTTPLAITISRKLGSGGAYVGHKLAEKLNLFYADHVIITRAAEAMSLVLDDIAPHEEKINSWWHNFWANTKIEQFINEGIQSFTPTTSEIFKTESEVIKQIAQEQPSVIIGRNGFHILDGYPGMVSIYLYGNIATRAKRLMEVRKITLEQALLQIEESDKSRAMYVKKFTKKNWEDVHNYDLAIDTSKIGLDNTVELIINYINLLKK